VRGTPEPQTRTLRGNQDTAMENAIRVRVMVGEDDTVRSLDDAEVTVERLDPKGKAKR
jgi:hypothetical protein